MDPTSVSSPSQSVPDLANRYRQRTEGKQRGARLSSILNVQVNYQLNWKVNAEGVRSFPPSPLVRFTSYFFLFYCHGKTVNGVHVDCTQ